MTTPSDPSRPAPPTVREIAELTARLRELSAQGAGADPSERAAFLADKDALLGRIIDADTDERLRGRAPDDATEALSEAARVRAVEPGTACPEMPGWMREQAARTEAAIAAGSAPPGRPDDPAELTARVADLRERVHGANAGPDAPAQTAAEWHRHGREVPDDGASDGAFADGGEEHSDGEDRNPDGGHLDDCDDWDDWDDGDYWDDPALLAGWRSMVGSTDPGEPVGLVCPECGEDAIERPPTTLVPYQAHGLPRPEYSHPDGEPLCPVMGPRGYQPAQPVEVTTPEATAANTADSAADSPDATSKADRGTDADRDGGKGPTGAAVKHDRRPATGADGPSTAVPADSDETLAIFAAEDRDSDAEMQAQQEQRPTGAMVEHAHRAAAGLPEPRPVGSGEQERREQLGGWHAADQAAEQAAEDCAPGDARTVAGSDPGVVREW